jgi:hypothetical protein
MRSPFRSERSQILPFQGIISVVAALPHACDLDITITRFLPHNEDLRGTEVKLLIFLTSALDAGKWPDSNYI